MFAHINNPPCFQRPSGFLYRSIYQEDLIRNTLTLVELNTIPAEYTDGIENIVTHRIIPGINGFYNISGQVTFFGCGPDSQCSVRILRNAVEIHRNTLQIGAGIQIAPQCNLPCQYLLSTDFLELWAVVYGTLDTVDIMDGIAHTFLTVQRVR